LLLTLRISQAQATPAASPAAPPKPVIDAKDSALSMAALVLRNPGLGNDV
jgi:hypothetical protein